MFLGILTFIIAIAFLIALARKNAEQERLLAEKQVRENKEKEKEKEKEEENKYKSLLQAEIVERGHSKRAKNDELSNTIKSFKTMSISRLNFEHRNLLRKLKDAEKVRSERYMERYRFGKRWPSTNERVHERDYYAATYEYAVEDVEQDLVNLKTALDACETALRAKL